MTTLANTPQFKAAVSHSPIFDLKNFFPAMDQLVVDSNFSGSRLPWMNAEDLDRWNPSQPDVLRNWKDAPPTLFIHSDKDYRCPVMEGYAAFKALKSQGVEARLLSFSEDRWVNNHENALVWHRTVFGWIDRWVGAGPTEQGTGGERIDGVDAGGRRENEVVVPDSREPIDWWL